MATPKFNSKSPTIRRILREAQELSASPSPDYTATPLETDLFEWHFTLRGPPNSAFGEGIYHGRIVLPPTYPLRPPSFRFLTPSGRFETNREICLSISGHHEETWQPAWGVRTALVALRSFMETDAAGQLGGLDTSAEFRRRLAAESGAFRCAACGRSNADIIAECEGAAREAEGAAAPREVEVPKELAMGYRDEMEAKAGAGAGAGAAGGAKADAGAQEDAEAAELAEGFVQTAPLPREEEAPPRASSLRARPAHAAPRPTRTVPLPDPQPVTPARQAQMQRQSDEGGVPAWVDRIIAVLVVLLIAMILRVVLKF